MGQKYLAAPPDGVKGNRQERLVTQNLREWLTGVDTSETRLYDLYEILPVWKTKWFWICVGTGTSLFLIAISRFT